MMLPRTSLAKVERSRVIALLRACSQLGARLKEAAKLGFRQAVIPKLLRNTENFPADIKVHQARSVRDAVQLVFLKRSNE